MNYIHPDIKPLPCWHNQRNTFSIREHHTLSLIDLVHYKRSCLALTPITWPTLIHFPHQRSVRPAGFLFVLNLGLSSFHQQQSHQLEGNKRSWHCSLVRVPPFHCCTSLTIINLWERRVKGEQSNTERSLNYNAQSKFQLTLHTFPFFILVLYTANLFYPCFCLYYVHRQHVSPTNCYVFDRCTRFREEIRRVRALGN